MVTETTRVCTIAAAVVLMLLSAAPPVRAQESDALAAPTNPSTLDFEHDARDVTGFVLYIRSTDSQVLRIDLGALQAQATGRFSAAIPPLPDGTYSLEVAAYNRAGESARVPGTPRWFTISRGTTKSAPQSSAAPSDSAHDHGTHPPAVTAGPEPPPADREGTPKKGNLRRIWRGIVGD